MFRRLLSIRHGCQATRKPPLGRLRHLGAQQLAQESFSQPRPIISKLRTNALFNVASRRKDSKCVIGACERM